MNQGGKMKKKELAKKILTIVTVAIFVMSCTCLSFASGSEDDSGETKAKYYSSALANISLNGETVTAVGKVVGNKSTTKITIKLYLQKKSNGSWSNVASWSGTKAGKDYKLQKAKAVSKGTYRTKASCTVYSGNNSEHVTKYSGSMTY